MMNRILYFIAAVVFLSSAPASAFWIWTPESRQWINPKYAVKETPPRQLDEALQALHSGDDKKAEQELRKILKFYPKAREAAEAQFYIAQIQESRADFVKAFESYQTVIEKYPFTERANEVVKRQFEIASRLLEARIEKDQGFWSRVSQAGTTVDQMFLRVIKNAPYSEYAAPAQYKAGIFLKEQGFLREARDAFEKTVHDYPQSEWASAARFQIALADADRSAAPGYDQQITETAIHGFKEFVHDFPDVELAQQARARVSDLREKEAESHFLVARFYEKQRNPEAALLYYSLIVNDYKDTSWADKAAVHIQRLEKR